MKKYFAVVFLISVFFNVTIIAQGTGIELPKGSVTLFDGFEKGNYWIWAGSDYDQYGRKYSAGASISNKWASEGKHSLACKIEPMPGTTGWYDGLWFYDGSQNFQGVRYVAIDINNATSKGFLISLVFQVTDEWNWKQTDFRWVNPGVTTLVYDVTEFGEFLDRIKRIQISMGTNTAYKNYETFYVDNFRLIK